MTIGEAVQLVLRAVGRTGELCLLDMGEPVRISSPRHDRLSGFEPDVDIKIEVTA